MYSGKNASKKIGAPGKKVMRPNIPGYKVFVQSKGIYHRRLKKDTEILYEVLTVLV